MLLSQCVLFVVLEIISRGRGKEVEQDGCCFLVVAVINKKT